MADGRKKIVVLGGGVGAMATAYHLTNPPDWREKYEITVYQLGWRLGGKGASGRGEYGRIEEHGLHMWYGFYENAFKMIQAVYKENGRKRGQPLCTWEEAFKPQNFTVYEEEINGVWKHWPLELPTNDSTPGEGGEFPTTADYISMLLQEMVSALVQAQEPEGPPPPDDDLPTAVKILPWWRKIAAEVEDSLEDTAYKWGILLLSVAIKLLEDLERWAILLPGDGSSTVIWLIDQFKEWLLKIVQKEMDDDDNLRRLWIMLDLLAVSAKGMIADKVHEKGLSSINHLDYIEWITQHGADPRYTVPFVRHNLYDQAFAFANGDDRTPDFAAGIVNYAAMRTYFTYKGAVLWKMQAGMGDTIFTPIYEVLQKRGVTFKFFHEVQNLEVSGDTISQISIGVQATVKPEVEKSGGYRPFRNIKGLNCWPSEPLYEQLVEGNTLQQDKIDLESFWTPWQNVGHTELEAGRDYDLIVFGISLGAVPFVCSELVKAKANWATMVQKVKTIQTQAFQLWLKPDDAGLGWPMWRRQSATLTGYDADDNPEQAGLDTWGDFSHLINRENWPEDKFPNNIAYVCGAMKAVDVLDLPPRSDTGYPAREQAKGEHNSRFFLNNYISHLWPEATQADKPQALDWDLVISDFYRVNIDPSERYVLSVADSVRHRIRPDDSGFTNLYPAGDWTDNGLMSVGCVESATIGGMQAANAILTQFGYSPVEIIGWAE